MSRLIFTNIAIHRFWEKARFTSPLVHDSCVNLGYFMATRGSTVIVDPAFDDDFLRELNRHRDREAEVLRIEALGDEKAWSQKILSVLPPRKWADFTFAGMSGIEERLLKELGGTSALDADRFRFLNRKSTLLRIAEDLKIEMPRSLVYSSESLDGQPAFAGPFVLKPDLGQSGAGQVVTDRVPRELMSAALRLKPAESEGPRWVLQQLIDVKHNLSLFGEAGKVIGAFEVFYDKGRSIRHTSPGKDMAEHVQMAAQTFEKIARYLKDKYGYGGAFGIDAIVDSEKQLYPAVDLNLRLDRSRMIFEAAQHFGLNSDQIESRVLAGEWDEFRGKKDILPYMLNPARNEVHGFLKFDRHR